MPTSKELSAVFVLIVAVASCATPPLPPSPPPPPALCDYDEADVSFSPGSARIENGAGLQRAINRARQCNIFEVRVVAFGDTQTLADARKASVVEALIVAGVPAGAINDRAIIRQENNAAYLEFQFR